MSDYYCFITGDKGFIGEHLVAELRAHDIDVSGWDIENGDLRKAHVVEAMFETMLRAASYLNKQPVLVHLAAQVGREFGERDVGYTVEENALMTARIARMCAEHQVKIAYASTSEVYGDRGRIMCYEDTPLTAVPHNLYGLTKRWGEEVCDLYLPPEDVVKFRFSMPYGTGVVPGRGRAALPNMIWQAQNRMEIPCHTGAERSWCWVGDTVRAVRMVLDSGESGAFNVGRDDDARQMHEIAERACEITGAPKSLIKLIDAPRNQTVVKRLATAKIEKLGWRPEVEINEGMELVLNWVKRFDKHGQEISVG